MGRRMLGTVVAAVVGAGGLGAHANVNIATVPVGDPGNAADTRYGYGAVAYPYNIGQYEVTAGQYTEFLNKVAGVDTYGLYNTSMGFSTYGCKIQRGGGGTVDNPYTYVVAPSAAHRPVNYVSWGDSARFANWLQNGQPTGAQDLSTTEDGAYFLNGATTDSQLLAVNRKAGWRWALTSENEWFKGAYYKGGSTNAGYWDYPTGSNLAPGRDLTDASGNNANYDGPPYGPIDAPYYTTVGGEFQDSASAYGTFDQGGNVWEWNEAALYGWARGLRGGSYNQLADNLRASVRGNNDPSWEYTGIGFRVSEIPEPGTAILLALAGVGVLRKNRA